MKRRFLNMSHSEQTTGWAWMVIQLFLLPSVVELLTHLFHLNISAAMLNVMLFCLNFIGTVTIFRQYLQHQTECIKLWRLLVFVPLGLVLYWLAATGVSYLIMQLWPAHINPNNQAVMALHEELPILMTIGIVFLVPITEETLFRGLLFGTVYKKYPVLGFIVSVLGFAVIHVFSYIGQQPLATLLISFLQYIPAGIVLSLSYLWARTLVAPILIHGIINLLATLQ